MGFLAHIIEQLRDRKVERIGSGNDRRNYSNMNPQEPTAITAGSSTLSTPTEVVAQEEMGVRC